MRLRLGFSKSPDGTAGTTGEIWKISFIPQRWDIAGSGKIKAKRTFKKAGFGDYLGADWIAFGLEEPENNT